ncbi:hypothetical protein bcgnr5390_16740 [Bacillus luti]|nr:hypothetical protein BC2903_54000 [Bacillus cereus]
MVPMMDGEQVVWSGRKGVRYRTFVFLRDFSIFAIIGYFVWFILTQEIFRSMLGDSTGKIYLSLILIGCLVIGIRQLSFMFLTYTITTERTIISEGFLSRNVASIKHEHIRDMKVKQTFFQRIIGIGNLYLFTANDVSENSKDKNFLNKTPCLDMIDSPFILHAKLEKLCEK